MRYFAPRQHNKPETLKDILKYNAIELYDLQNDPRYSKIDVRVGGKHLICMASPDGSMKMWTTGEYME